MLRKNKQKNSLDRNLFYLTIVLVVLGLIAVADASAPQALNVFNDRFYFFKEQATWALIGLVAMILVSNINYKFWQKLSLPILIISLISVIAVLIPGVGTKVLGARRWIFIGPINIQPSEIAKFAIALSFASLASKSNKILPYLILLGMFCVLIMFQPDLGTTLIVASIGYIQMFLAGVNIFQYFGSIIVGLLASIGTILTSAYRRSRLLTFFKQSNDPLGESYHIRQILLSLGLGGVSGVGLGASRQKYLFLPEAATDSIFAIIAEEIGFIGGAVLILLFVYFVYKGLKIAYEAPDKFSQIFSAGIIGWIAVQVFLNIGSVVALVPLTGVPLPFISYGGSSLSTILVSVGILLNISRYRVKKATIRKR